MNLRSAYLAGLGVLLGGLMPTPASAQEAGDVGVTVSAPSAIGVIWHVTPRVAIRPDLSFSFNESDAEVGTDISSKSFSFGGSVLFYTGRWDNLQTYVTPRLSYSWSSSSIDSLGGLDATQDGWGLSGSFGAQYTLGTRFAVFAEAGLLYASQTSETPSSFGDNERTSWTFGTRTAIGATLYF
jgi:hypothetical protein